jgi:hypothetical protein
MSVPATDLTRERLRQDLVEYVRPAMSSAAAMTSELAWVVVEVTCAANV